MRKNTIILIVLIAAAISTNAQIPNSGFEDWNTMGSYMEPQGWATTNPYSAGPFYAVTRSTDHYPSNVGNYSVRIENDTSLLPNYPGYGIIMPDTLDEPQPVFPITGHPTSFTGYYKYAPLNGDTMSLSLGLYLNGSSVAWAQLSVSVSVSNWTSFNIPISGYATADSAHIILSTYRPGPLPTDIPRGNSVLYIDNLNFDSLITYASAPISKNTSFNLFPNPASDIVTLDVDNTNNEELALNFYNIMGELVKSEILKQNQREINIGGLDNGIYMLIIRSKSTIENKKLIIQN